MLDPFKKKKGGRNTVYLRMRGDEGEKKGGQALGLGLPRHEQCRGKKEGRGSLAAHSDLRGSGKRGGWDLRFAHFARIAGIKSTKGKGEGIGFLLEEEREGDRINLPE